MGPAYGECSWSIVDRSRYTEAGFAWFVYDTNGDCVEHGIAPDERTARGYIAFAVARLIICMEGL